MKLMFFILTTLLIPYKFLFSQEIGDFRTKQNGNWNQTTTWQRFNGVSWENATTIPTYSDGIITVQSGHTVTVTADVQIDQTIVYGTIIINESKELRIRDGNGTDLQVYGIIFNSGKLRHHTAGSPTLNYNSGAKYIHAVNGDRVEYATWNANATCEIVGVTNSKPSRLDQNFGNVVWNCTQQTKDFTLLDDLTQIQGNFSLLSTNNMDIELSNTSSRVMNIAGNFLIDNTAKFTLSDKSADNVMNVGGSFTIKNGSYFYMSKGNGYTTLNVKGDFIMTGGILSQNSSYNRATINFNGTAPQTYTKSGGIMYYGINFYIKSGASVDFGTSVLGNYTYTNGSFTLESGATLKTAHNEGISTNGGQGCIQVQGTRYYHTHANYTFYRNGAQASGDGLKTEIHGILTIGSTNSATQLSLPTEQRTIHNKLILVSSGLSNSSIVTGSIAYSSNGVLEYQGYSTQTTANTEFPEINGPRIVTINNQYGVLLHASRNITTALNLQQGQFSIGNNTLTLKGVVNQISGNWSGGMNSNLVIDDSEISTILPSITLNNLTVNRYVGIGLGGNINVHGATIMTNGNITSNGYFINYGENGTLLYNSSINQTCSDTEFPGINGPKNLTIQNPTIVLLHASRTIDGTLTLNSGMFAIGSNILTINGIINRTTGDILGGTTSDIIFGENENLTYLPPVVLNNLTVSRSCVILMEGSVTVNNVNLNKGNLLIGSNHLTINGLITKISGTLEGGNFSSLTIGGTGIPTDLHEITLNNLTINRPQGVSLSGNLTIKGLFHLLNGIFQIGSNTIFMEGYFQQTEGILNGGANSNIEIRPDMKGFNPVYLPGVELCNLFINRNAGVIINGDVTVHQSLVINTGSLFIGSNTLILNGELIEAGGFLQASENSSLIIGGEGTAMNIGVSSLKLFQLNRETGIQLYNNLQIFDQMILINGSINLNDFMLTYQPGASLQYAGNTARICSNAEFPETNGPTNIEINNISGITLHENRTIQGNLVILNGNFYISNNKLTLNGDLLAGFSEFFGRLIGSEQSELIIGGDANVLHLHDIMLHNLTVNRPMGVFMIGNLNLFGVLMLNDGQLRIMNNLLTLRNPVLENPDFLIFSPESSLEIAGEAEGMNIGMDNNLRISDIKNLTISNTHESGIMLNGNLNIWSNLIVKPNALFIIGENKILTIYALP
ncbi:MAG: hypothetical protein WBJ84_10585 [Bacteroidales bacterium]